MADGCKYSKESLRALFFLISGDILVCSLIIRFIAVSALKHTSDMKSENFGNEIFWIFIRIMNYDTVGVFYWTICYALIF